MKNHWRYRNSFVEYRGDGRFKKDRIKGKDKRELRKKTLRKFWSEKDNRKNF